MQVTVKYFASIRETIGQPLDTIATEAETVAALRDALIARGPAHAQALSRTRAVRCAMNQVMVEEDAALVDGAEVAFFPPVTGG